MALFPQQCVVKGEGQGPEPTPQFLPGLGQPTPTSAPMGAACDHCSPSLLTTSVCVVEPGYVEGNILVLAITLTLRKGLSIP